MEKISMKELSLFHILFLYALMAAWICSSVFPFVSGTMVITNTIESALMTA